MSDLNHQVRLARRPSGMLTPEVWEMTEEPLTEPAEGQVLVAVELLSLDPAMRGWLNDVPSYVPPVGDRRGDARRRCRARGELRR